MNDLVDTTEMYLRTILELEEEGVTPLRARIAERLHQSGPTVSQTVNRMERDGLLTVEGDRHLLLTDLGRSHAVAVMRKHRLAELLLVNVIGLPYEEAHEEACRWEHVMSEAVEQRSTSCSAGRAARRTATRSPASTSSTARAGPGATGPATASATSASPASPARSSSAASARACRPTSTCCASCTRPASTRAPRSTSPRTATRS